MHASFLQTVLSMAEQNSASSMGRDNQQLIILLPITMIITAALLVILVLLIIIYAFKRASTRKEEVNSGYSHLDRSHQSTTSSLDNQYASGTATTQLGRTDPEAG